MDGDYAYLPYGAYFWCDSRYPLDTLVKAIRRYNIDIHNSTESTDGDWRSLPQYPQLCSIFPNPADTTAPHSTPSLSKLYPIFYKTVKPHAPAASPTALTRTNQLDPTPIHNPTSPPLTPKSTTGSPELTRRTLANLIDISIDLTTPGSPPCQSH